MNLKRPKKTRIYYDEDRNVKIEVLPKENAQICLDMIKNDVSYDNLADEDYWVELVEKNIPKDDLIDLCGIYLNKYNDVYAADGMDSQKIDDTIAFGYDNTQIMIKYSNKKVSNIWINGMAKNKRQVKGLIKVLEKLGRIYNLIICDWQLKTIVSLGECEEVTKILHR